ncbi:MAG: beta-glucosidase BglX [Sediminibacterium sp.]|nr:beta-glucosidase BglX [Sediminibacterium sp.]
MKKNFIAICGIIILFLFQAQQPTLTMDLFIDNLMSKMTLDEKLGQLNLPASGDIVTGKAVNSDIAIKIKEGKVGGLFNIKGVAKIYELQKVAVEQSRLKIPLIFGMDVIHGYETSFPIPLGLSCTWDMELIKKTAQIAAKECSADGINWTFSPMVDIARDPRWGRVAEGSGEDPFLGSEIAKAMVQGYQGNLKTNYEILTCIKHYALYGASEAGRDYNTTDMSKLRMYNEYFPPYKAAIDAGAASIMASFNDIDGIPATGNKWLLTEVLKNQWGFKGFVVSDYTGVSEMVNHGIGNIEEVAALSLNAGLDMDMVSESFLKTFPKSLKENKIKIERINAACRKILEAKYKLGLFENPYKFIDVNRAKNEIFTAENRSISRNTASQSFVLLKNDKQTLPISNTKTIALIGPLANNAENMPGTWSVATNHAKSISVLEGLKTGLSTNKILYAKGANLADDRVFEDNATMFGKTLHRDNRSKESLIQEAIEIAQQADIIVFAGGEAAEMSGESASITNIDIPAAQKDILKELKKLNKPMVLVLFTGRPLTLEWESKNIDAILNVWFPGTEAGLAIADVLSGKVNPAGKLSMTFPLNVGQIPIYYAHKNTGRPLTGKWFQKFQSNYLDVPNEPLYPFGYGLSYTKFEYGEIKLTSNKITKNKSITATIQVTNTGEYAGAEVVQLYIHDKVRSITQPVKELKGFKKIYLEKNQTQSIQFTIDEKMLRFYNSNLKYVSEKGDFEIMIGTNSNAVKVANLELVD